MAARDIIVIGASAGGVEAYTQLAGLLAPGIPAAIFMVLHLAPGAPSEMPRILSRCSRLPVAHAVDNQPIQHGRIYVAPPDVHMLIKPRRIRLLRGAMENFARPAVDPLFRSAAEAYGERVVGVVLTGLLDDGTAGLKAVRAHGGLAVVQDPEEAIYPSMPRSAILHVDVNHILPIAEIASLVDRLAREQPAAASATIPLHETPDILERVMDGACDPSELGNPSTFTCPECGGSLMERVNGGLTTYRCRVGHAYSAAHLDTGQSVAVEDALWAAVRALEERAQLMRRMATEMELVGNRSEAAMFTGKAQMANQHASVVQQVFLKQRSGEDKNALGA